MNRERAADGPLISGYSGGGFRVDDNVYRALLLRPDRAAGWVPPAIDGLTVTDLGDLFDGIEAEFLLLGTGSALVRPSPAFVTAIEDMGLGVEAMDSRAAARAWGVLRGEGRRIVAALYPLD